MKFTNRSDLPDALVRAIQNDPYDKGDAEYSVTGLLTPPRITVLKERHAHEIEEDVEDRLYSLYGQIAHTILERANVNQIAEKRYFGQIDDIRISAQIDTLDLEAGLLSDFKFTTAWKFKPNHPAPEDWVAQLNMQLELLRQNGLDAKALQIIGLIRDFSKLEALRNPKYPRQSVVRLPIELWERERTINFMRARIRAHRQARVILPECSSEERWAKASEWAVMKAGNKKATKVHYSQLAADAHAASDPKLSVIYRPGESVRCKAFCPASKVCSQYATIKAAEPQSNANEKEQVDGIPEMAE